MSNFVLSTPDVVTNGPMAPVRAVLPPLLTESFALTPPPSATPREGTEPVKQDLQERLGGQLGEEIGEPDDFVGPQPSWKKHVLPKPFEGAGGDVTLGDGAGENQEMARALWALAVAAEESDPLAARKLKNKAQRLACCGQYARLYRAEAGCGRQGYRTFNCGLRICPRCAPILARKLFEKFVVLEKSIQRRNGWTLALLDFTLKNTGVLPDAELIREANQAVRRTMKRLRRGQKGWGYLWVDELGFDNTNLHVHGISYGPFIPQHEISRVWAEESGGSFVVWIQEINHSFRAALWHHLGYVSKPPSNDPRRLAEIEAAFSVPRVVRKVHTMAAFYDLGDVTEADVENASGGNCPCGCGAALVLVSGYRPVSEFKSSGFRSWDELRREIVLARIGAGPP